MLRKLYNSSIEIVFIDQTRTNKQEMFFLHFFAVRSSLMLCHKHSLFFVAPTNLKSVSSKRFKHTHTQLEWFYRWKSLQPNIPDMAEDLSGVLLLLVSRTKQFHDRAGHFRLWLSIIDGQWKNIVLKWRHVIRREG